MPTDLRRVNALVQRALDDFDEPHTTVSASLRRCLRIATLRNDYPNILWLELEAGVAGDTGQERANRRQELAAHFTQEEWEKVEGPTTRAYIIRRTIGEDRVWGGSVQSAEDHLVHLQQQASLFDLPANLTPIDAALMTERYGVQKSKFYASMLEMRGVLSRIKDRLHRFLVETERQLEYGRVQSDIFERNREYVDERLHRLAPEAFEQFDAAYRRVADGDAESLSHALTSCRRILKTYADAIYPPRDEPVRGADGKERPLNDARYLNRLVQFVSDRIGKHGVGEMVQTRLNDLHQRLRAIDSMASKGVHATATAGEVDMCVIQTYLIVGDIMRIHDGVAAAPSGDEVAPAD